MNRLSQNELIGTVAIQSALDNSERRSLPLSKAMLVLPLVFDRAIRAVLKRKNSIVLSSKDLLISNPAAFITIRARYDDLIITSLNTIILAKEIGMVSMKDDLLVLERQLFSRDGLVVGKIALDILDAGPKLGIILGEAAEDLYQTFRIEL
jgi:hypothetical protein